MAEGDGLYPTFNWGDMPNPDLPPFVPKGGAAGGVGAQGSDNYADAYMGQRMPGMRMPRNQYGAQLPQMPMGGGSYNASMQVPRGYNLSMMQLLSALMRMRRG